jgi:hypothetical protein
MASIAHILAITLLIIALLFVLNRVDLVDSACLDTYVIKPVNGFTAFVVRQISNAGKLVGLGK